MANDTGNKLVGKYPLRPQNNNLKAYKWRVFMLLTAVITEAEEGGFIALNPETGTTTQGETYQEAIQNLKEATTLYLDEFPMKIHSHPVMTTFEVKWTPNLGQQFK
jgi:predicted RNase H-like HicB family nuclease